MEKPDADTHATNELDAPELVVDAEALALDDNESDPPPMTRGGPPPLPPQHSIPPEAARASAPPAARVSVAPSVAPPPASPKRLYIAGGVLLVLVGVAVVAGVKVGAALNSSRAGAAPSAPSAASGVKPIASPAESSGPTIAIPTVEF